MSLSDSSPKSLKPTISIRAEQAKSLAKVFMTMMMLAIPSLMNKMDQSPPPCCGGFFGDDKIIFLYLKNHLMQL